MFKYLQQLHFRYFNIQHFRIAGFLLVFAFFPQWVQGQTWSGLGAGNDWSNSANWAGGAVPVSNQNTQVTFDNPSNQNSSNLDIADPFTLNRLAIDTSNGGFSISGNTMRFSGSASSIFLSGNQQASVDNDWLLALPTSVSLTSGTATLIHNGDVTGNQTLTASGGLTLNGNYTNTGALIASLNVTRFNGTMSGGDAVEVAGTLSGNGTINRNVELKRLFNANDLTINATGTMTIMGDLSVIATSDSNNSPSIEGDNLIVNGNTLLETNGASLSIASTTYGGTGNIQLASLSTLSINSAIGSGQTIIMNGQQPASSNQGTRLVGSGSIAGNTQLIGGVVYGNLTFDGDVEIVAHPSFGVKFGTATTFGTNALPRSQLTVNGNVNIAQGDNSASVGGDFSGSGSFDIQSGVATSFQSAVIGSGLTVNLSGTMSTSTNTGTSGGEASSFDGTLNLNGGTLNTQFTNYGGTVNVFDGSTINSIGSDNRFNGLVIVQNGSSTGTGNITGAGTMIIESGATFNTEVGPAQVDLDKTVRGQLTGGSHLREIRLEGGVLAGEMILNSDMIVQTGLQSLIEAGANVGVTGLSEVRSGELRVDSGASLLGIGVLQVNTAGVLDIQGSVFKDVNVLEGGMLEGTGLVKGNLIIDGLLDPGNSAGTIDIDGDIDLTETSTVCVEIGGELVTEYDIADGLGNSNMDILGGDLEISLINGFMPDSVDRFDFFIGFSSLTGAFRGTTNGSSFGENRIYFEEGSFAIEYQSDSASLFDFVAVPEPGSVCLLGGIGLAMLMRRKRFA